MQKFFLKTFFIGYVRSVPPGVFFLILCVICGAEGALSESADKAGGCAENTTYKRPYPYCSIRKVTESVLPSPSTTVKKCFPAAGASVIL